MYYDGYEYSEFEDDDGNELPIDECVKYDDANINRIYEIKRNMKQLFNCSLEQRKNVYNKYCELDDEWDSLIPLALLYIEENQSR